MLCEYMILGYGCCNVFAATCSLEMTGHTLGQEVPVASDEVLYSGCHQF